MLKIAVLSISSLIISFAAVAGVFPALIDALGLSQMQGDLMMTIPALAVVIFIFVSNWVAPRIGIKQTVVLGMLLSGVGGIFPAFVQSFIPILVSRFFLGAGVGLINTWAVRYITLLFDEKERAKMMGYRSSAEIIGQTIVAILTSLLFPIGWHLGFLAYSIAFVGIFLIIKYVPPVDFPQDTNRTEKTKMPFAIYLLTIFAMLVVMAAATIAFRYAAVATEILGLDYNASIMMSLWPSLSIVAALTFGKLNALLGRKLLYCGMILLITASFISGFSAGNYWLVVLGLFLHGIVPAWIFPFIFMTAAKMTDGKTQSVAFSYIAAGIKIGVFSLSFNARLIEIIFKTTSLSAPYMVYGTMMLLMLIFILVAGRRIVHQSYLVEK